VAAEAIEFTDIEDVLRRYLAPLLPQAGVFAGVTPAELPPLSMTVVRTGGVQRSLILDEPLLSFDCRAASRLGAAVNLAGRARALIGAAAREGMLAEVPFYAWRETSGPYGNPDPRNPAHHRVSFAGQATVRGAAPPVEPGPVTYTVKPGDTLWSIAQGHGVTVVALRAANNVSESDLITVGQVLVIPM
jgi:LysM repeat protein